MCALAALSRGYAANTRFVYEPPRLRNPRAPQLDIAVEWPRDVRGPRSYPSRMGLGWLSYIPLIPYIKTSYERLDESLAINQRQRGEETFDANLFPSLIASALVTDMLKSGLARDSFVVRDGESSRPAHVLLTGKLRSTEFDDYLTSYMLGWSAYTCGFFQFQPAERPHAST